MTGDACDGLDSAWICRSGISEVTVGRNFSEVTAHDNWEAHPPGLEIPCRFGSALRRSKSKPGRFRSHAWRRQSNASRRRSEVSGLQQLGAGMCRIPLDPRAYWDGQKPTAEKADGVMLRAHRHGITPRHPVRVLHSLARRFGCTSCHLRECKSPHVLLWPTASDAASTLSTYPPSPWRAMPLLNLKTRPTIEARCRETSQEGTLSSLL